MKSCLAVLALAGCSLDAQTFFLQLADTQMGMYANNRNTVQEEANLDFVIATANRLKPAFVVVCGDLINNAGDPSEIAAYKRGLEKLNKSISIYNVAGNHDVGNEPTPQSLATYREQFGPDYYTFDYPGMRGIVLDSSIIQAPKNVPDQAKAQEEWLNTELEKAKAERVRRVIIFQHIPYFLEKPDEPDQYFNIPIATRKRYLDLFARYGVHTVFAGHYHRNAYGYGNGVEVITNGPVSIPMGADQSGFRAVIVRDEAIETRYYELGRMPNAILPAEPLP
jgi:3',5'-cyclic AMP phosphodiesterase CpdA